MLWEQVYRKESILLCSTKPLALLGEFESDVSLIDNTCTLKRVKFYVIRNKASSLLSRVTAEKLGVLKLGLHQVNSVTVNEEVMCEYKDCFQVLGMLTDYNLKLHIDSDVTPVAIRCIQYH